MIHYLKLTTGVAGIGLLFASTALANVAQTVPEPATLTLLAAGGAGFYLLNRRRRT